MLRVAAINFLNPAPLMWDFEHPPCASELAERYSLHYTQPSLCAAELLAGRADLGLIPIAALTPELAIVKSYDANVTGLASMIAYNMILAIIPIARCQSTNGSIRK